jgi:hypothetical protein
VKQWTTNVTRPVRRLVAAPFRLFVFHLSLAFLRGTQRAPAAVLWSLRWGWGNEGFSASVEFCQAILAETRLHDAPVIELGSGLTTVLLAARRVPVTAIEHESEWASRVRRSIRWANEATVLHRPLIHYEGYDWYGLQSNDLPSTATFVVCDGPPGRTIGGRYGLLPVVRPTKGTVILLDDAAREGERAVLQRWKQEAAVSYEVIQARKPYARVVV